MENNIKNGIRIVVPKGDSVKSGTTYVLEKSIGEGSFGEVWLAHDENDADRKIAIKFYIPLDEAGRKLFFEEYNSSSNLNHKNLLSSFFYGEWNRRPYIGMEYCANGASSKHVGNLQPRNDEEIIWRFIRDTAAGLQFLHENEELVHQDIKPDNILIDGDGNYVIMDFGISKKARATLRSQSKRSNSAGAPAYMAPERFTSDPMIIFASDIWSLGASVYELATGELPFNGMGGGLLNAGAELPELKGWSKELNMVMQRCLAKEPWERKRACEIKEYANWVLCGKIGVSPWNYTDTKEEPMCNKVPYIPEQPSYVLRDFLVSLLVCVVFVFGFVMMSPTTDEKIANYWYPQYLSLVERCHDSIVKGGNSNTQTLLASKRLMDSISYYQRCYGDVLPQKYNRKDELQGLLDVNLTHASKEWAKMAKLQYDVTGELDIPLQQARLAYELYKTNEAVDIYNLLVSKVGNMVITNIEFSNSDDKDYSKPMMASSLKFITPRITCDGLNNEESSIMLDIRIIEPDGELSKGNGSSYKYTYRSEVSLKPGKNQQIELLGWGNKNGGTFSPGKYSFEVWYRGIKVYSKDFVIG